MAELNQDQFSALHGILDGIQADGITIKAIDIDIVNGEIFANVMTSDVCTRPRIKISRAANVSDNGKPKGWDKTGLVKIIDSWTE